jgi:hypothetical protein
MEIRNTNNTQTQKLREICESKGIKFNSLDKLLQAEKVKKLQKRNHYIQQAIDSEIENSLHNENK